MRYFIVSVFALIIFALTSNAQTTPTATVAPSGTTAKTTGTANKTTVAKAGTTSKAKKKSGDAIDKADAAIDNANSKVDRASNTGDKLINTVSNTSDHAKALSKKAKTLAPKQEIKAPATIEKLNVTEFKIKGLNFATLNKLNENIQSCSGVKSSAMEFSGSRSTIIVNHNGTSANLLKLIQEKSKDIFTDENIDDFKEGKVSIKIKQN